MSDSNYVSTDPILLLILLIMLIIILTCIFDKYVNPYSENHTRITKIIAEKIGYMSPMMFSYK